MTAIRTVGLLMGLAALLGAEGALAAPPAPPAPNGGEAQRAEAAKVEPAKADPAKQAEALFREGNALVAQQRWAEAEQRFLAAYALRPTYDVAANLGHTQVRLGKLRDAATHLALAVRQWPLTGKQEPKQLAEKRLAELRRKLGVARVTVSAAGAEVLVDGRRVGTSPIEHEVFVDPGVKATVEARLAGHEAARQVVEAKPGEELRVELTLEREEAAAKAPGPMAAAGPGPRAGAGVGAALPGRDERNADGGGALGPRTAILIAGGALAGVGLVTGVVMTVVANGKASDADAQAAAVRAAGGPAGCATPTPQCEELRSTLRGAADLGSAALWSFVGAGVVGGATLAYGLLTMPRASTAGAVGAVGAVGAAPVVTAQGGGVMVQGRW